MVRIAVLGAGVWGANHVRVTASEPSCELAWIVDPDGAARERISKLGPTSSDASHVLEAPSVDAVIVATPAPSHVELACAALRAGKHVLVEKPCALSIDGARQLAATAAERRRICMVGHLLVFHPAVVRMRDAIRGAELGHLQYIQSTRASAGRIRTEEGVLWSFGPHDLSILDYVLEDFPVSVTARGLCLHHPAVEDVAFVTIRYASGVLAELHLSRVHPRKERTFDIVGSQRILRFDEMTPHALQILMDSRDVHRKVTVDGYGEPLRLQLQHFIRCIETDRAPTTDIVSGLRITRVLEAAQRSLAQDGMPVAIDRT